LKPDIGKLAISVEEPTEQSEREVEMKKQTPMPEGKHL